MHGRARRTRVRALVTRRRRGGAVSPREPLAEITDDDVAREGFPEFDVGAFVDFYCEHMKIKSQDEITRVEWRYLDSERG
jgi:hypothetical protein